ncbi:MAG: hypothetical protein IT168_06195 [Bryobacterales bacterium]|nr:hypothetical protein [Bryobacterales bacterium]
MSATAGVFFDDSLPVFVKALSEIFGQELLRRGVVLRDTSGRLRFINPEAPPPDEVLSRYEARLAAALGAYVRHDGAISFIGDPGAQQLLDDPAAFPMRLDTLEFRLLDRRIVGAGWTEQPAREAVGPPRIVFASLKGGVGRSTALAVTASDLARRKRNILVVDLDLEAPGVGEMLLDEGRLPNLGTVDYLVENGLGGVPDERVADFIGTSALTTPGGGRVDVVPVLGRRAIANPENTLAKLARAMIEDIDPEGRPVPVTVKMAEMVKRFLRSETYDVVLIDSRAGLSEIAAPTVLGLGANVLLFGTAQRQTMQGYAALFAALKLLAERDRAAGRPAEWRLLFKAVQAKASLDERITAGYRDELYDLFAEGLYDAEDMEGENPEVINFGIDDPSAPHWPLVIPFTQNFVDFDPVRAPTQLTAAFYEQAYRPFLDGIDAIIAASGVTEETDGHE